MRIFVTGASGFIGSAIVAELLRAGHRVTGLARSDASAAAVTAAGAEPHRGNLEDLASLRAGAAACDGVIHTGFVHDFANFKAMCELDGRVIAALGAEFAGSARPLLVSSGVALGGAAILTEDVRPAYGADAIPRVATEQAVDTLAERGVRAGALRFAPSVHGEGDRHGFVPILVELARKTGVSAYIGDGANRWPGVHRLDAASLARLAVESTFAPGTRFHAVADEGVPFRAIAEAIGRGAGVPTAAKSPDEAAAHFGWFTHFAALDRPASSQRTRDVLGWQPRHPGLLADLAGAFYFAR